MKATIRTLGCALLLFAVHGLPATARGQSCEGDCDDSGEVTVDEIISGVSIALGLQPVDACRNFDRNVDGEVTVDEVLAAVNRALAGCPDDVNVGIFVMCEVPGPRGLVRCARGTNVRLWRCDDDVQCFSERELIASQPIDANGTIVFVLGRRQLGSGTLIAEADVDANVTYQVVEKVRVGTIGQPPQMRTAGGTSGSIELTISPASEAATRILATAGLENFDADAVRAVVAAVAQANSETLFDGLGAAVAADRATEVALADEAVQELLSQSQRTLGCLQSRRGAIRAVGEVAEYEFFAKGAERMVLSTFKTEGETSFQPCWSIRNALGAAVRLDQNQARRCGAGGFTAPADGIYFMRVFDDASRAVGEYEILLEPRSATFGGQETCAPVAGCGSVIQGQTLNPRAADVYRLDGMANQRVSVSVLRVDGDPGYQPCWFVRDENGNEVRLVPNQADSCSEREVVLREGRHTIVVGDGARAASGTYELRIEPRSATLGRNAEASCAPEIGCGAAFVGVVPTRVASATYQFRALEGEIVAVAISREDGDPGFSPCWTVRSPNGSAMTLLPNVDEACDDRRSLRIGSSDVHTIVVRDGGQDATGTFNVRLEPVSESVDGEQCAAPIDCSAAGVGAISTPRFANTYGFFATAGARYRFSAVRESGQPAFNPCWTVTDRNGAAVRLLPNATSQCDGARDFTPSSSGWHTITVRDRTGGSATGTYGYEFSCL